MALVDALLDKRSGADNCSPVLSSGEQVPIDVGQKKRCDVKATLRLLASIADVEYSLLPTCLGLVRLRASYGSYGCSLL